MEEFLSLSDLLPGCATETIGDLKPAFAAPAASSKEDLRSACLKTTVESAKLSV